MELIRRAAGRLKEISVRDLCEQQPPTGLLGFVLFEELPGFFEVKGVSVDD
jgi:hypothetical protein